MQRFARTSTLAAVMLVAGCAAGDRYLASDDTVRAPCPADRAYSCVEYTGKTLYCSCASREDLRRILEPGRNP